MAGRRTIRRDDLDQHRDPPLPGQRREPLDHVTGALVAAGTHLRRQTQSGNIFAAVVAVVLFVVVLVVATVAAIAAVLVGLVRLLDTGHRRRLAAREAAVQRAMRERARDLRELQQRAPQWAAWAATHGMPHTARAWQTIANDRPLEQTPAQRSA